MSAIAASSSPKYQDFLWSLEDDFLVVCWLRRANGKRNKKKKNKKSPVRYARKELGPMTCWKYTSKGQVDEETDVVLGFVEVEGRSGYFTLQLRMLDLDKCADSVLERLEDRSGRCE